MAPLITTYRHDYLDPREMALSVTMAARSAAHTTSGAQSKDAQTCDCSPPDQLPELNAKAGATDATRGQSEWTGIAPMGILIKPRIISGADGDQPNDTDADSSAGRTCFVEKPNQYLANLENNSPSLYDDLRKMNKDDLQQIINTDRLRSTYQADYGGMAEYPSGTYDRHNANDDRTDMIRTFKAELADPCSEDAVFKDHRTRIKRCGYRPPRRPDVCAKHCPVVQGHWQAEKKQLPCSEYAAVHSHIGQVILRKNLNDHCKCKPSYCKHAIMYSLLAKS